MKDKTGGIKSPRETCSAHVPPKPGGEFRWREDLEELYDKRKRH